MKVLAFDTSNYTTSVSAFDGTEMISVTRLLKVRPGELGLRQSDALFAHIQNLPDLVQSIFNNCTAEEIDAVGASTRPRNVEGSYMPCFLAGANSASEISSVLHVPSFRFSHQQGHLAAVLWSAGRLDLLDEPFLAWHLSGGTTELLYVSGKPGRLNCQKIGGTTDISVGQIIDRTGKLLEEPFPAGKYLQDLALKTECNDSFAIRQDGLSFSISGLENKMQQYYAQCESKERTAAFVLNSIAELVFKVTDSALKQYPGLEVVFSGGVSSNLQLRTKMNKFSPVFGESRFSTDNAAGVSVLTWYEMNQYEPNSL